MRLQHPLLEELTAAELAEAMGRPDAPLLVDVRTSQERAAAAIEPSVHLPLDRLVELAPSLVPQDADVVVYCHVGMRSAQAAVWLVANGWARARSLAGGIDARSLEVDPDVPRY